MPLLLSLPPAIYSSQSLVENMLGFPPSPSPQINEAVTILAAAAARLDWTCLEEVEISLCLRPLSHAIDDALYQRLLSSAPTTCLHALALPCGLPHAGDWLNVVHHPP